MLEDTQGCVCFFWNLLMMHFVEAHRIHMLLMDYTVHPYAFLHCMLAAAQCIVIGPVCAFVCLWVCVRNWGHRSSPNWVCS